MKSKIIFLATSLCISLTLNAQAIRFTSTLTTAEIGSTISIGYDYTIATEGYIYCAIELLDDWAWSASVASAELNSAPAGTSTTGTFNLTIPLTTTPSADLTGNFNYKIRIELKNSAFEFQAGEYPDTQIELTSPATAGLEDISADGLLMYPNPVSDILRIKNADVSELKSFQIIDILGRIVIKQNNDKKVNQIDVSKLSKGLYFLTTNTNRQFKFLKR